MKLKTVVCTTVLLSSFAWVAQVGAHTPSERYEMAKSLVELAYFDSSHDQIFISREGVITNGFNRYTFTWPAFIDYCNTPGWTHEEKKAAFGYYLSTLGTNDCVSMSGFDKKMILVAVNHCLELKFTEAWPSMKALALNPRGIERALAIETAITLGPVDDAMTDFVEQIGTNVASYGYVERGTYCFYQQRLAAIPATNATEVAVRDRAVRRFYNHRIGPSAAGAVSRDFLFRDYIEGYAQSSNRLEFANYVLTNAECQSHVRRYFTSITNQLLSSGQPLRQVNLDAGGER